MTKYVSLFVFSSLLVAATLFMVVVTFSDMIHKVEYFSVYQPLSTGNGNISCITGQPCTYTDAVDLRIIVITFNRPRSLSTLLHSLDTLVLDEYRASLEIWIDRDGRTNAVNERTLDVANAFSWNGGSTHVHIQVVTYT